MGPRAAPVAEGEEAQEGEVEEADSDTDKLTSSSEDSDEGANERVGRGASGRGFYVTVPVHVVAALTKILHCVALHSGLQRRRKSRV